MSSRSLPLKGESIAALLAFLCVGMGIAGILLATPCGIGLSPDSIVYIGGARNILDGKGFSMPPADKPIVHFAPFYSLLLAISGLFGFDPLDGARGIAAAFLGLNIFLIFKIVGLTFHKIRSVPVWICAAIVLLALVAKPMWDIHLYAWTEPIYLACWLAGMWMLIRYLENTSLRVWLIAAGSVSAIAILTRYAGISMWGAFCVILVLFGPRPIARKIRHIIIFSGISLMPFLLWAVRNYLTAGSATNRSISLHPIGRVHFEQALMTIANWIAIPPYASGKLKLGALVVLAAAALLMHCRWCKHASFRPSKGLVPALPTPVRVIGICAFVYMAFLFLSVSFVDANTPMDQRLLSPLFVCLLILIAFSLSQWNQVFGRRRMPGAALVLLVCLACAGHVRASYSLLKESAREGLGFNNLRWYNSALISEIRKRDTGIIYSNLPPIVYLHTGKSAKGIPISYFRVTRQGNDNYSQDIMAMKQDLVRGGVFIFFNLGANSIPDNIISMAHALELKPQQTYADGIVYVR